MPPRESIAAAGEFEDFECWCKAPPGDPNFTSLKLCFVEGLVTYGIETLKRMHKPLTADGM